MRCDACRERFSEYLESRLPAEAAGEVERHLASCPRCAQGLADLRAVVDAVHAMPPVSVPAGFVERVHARVAPGVEARRRAPVWRWVAVSAGFAVLALVALAVFGPHARRASVMNSLAGGSGPGETAPARIARPAPQRAAQPPAAAPAPRWESPSGAPAFDHKAAPPAAPAKPAARPAPSAPVGEAMPPVASARLKASEQPAPASPPPGPPGMPGSKERARTVAGTLVPGRAAPAGAEPGLTYDETRRAAGVNHKQKPKGAVSVTAPPPYSAPAETIRLEKAPAAERGTSGGAEMVTAPTAGLALLAHPAPKPAPAWCILTLRESPARAGAPYLFVEAQVAARNVSLRARGLAGPAPVMADRRLNWLGVEEAPIWQAPQLSAGTTTALPLARLPQPAPVTPVIIGSPRLSAIYRLDLAAENQPASGYLLFMPPTQPAPAAPLPGSAATDVLRALTAQSGIYLLVPESVARAPNLALARMPPQQALASALQALGLTLHQDGTAWTAQ